MYRDWEVRWEGDIDGTPEQVWAAITEHAGGWLWPVQYEPREGGRETGLGDGVITVWEPHRRLQTLTEREDGYRNELTYELEPAAGGTHLSYRHRSRSQAEEYDVELAACRAHTDLYYHSLGQYVAHFAGREPEYVESDRPDGTLADARRELGLGDDPQVGDRVTVQGEDGVVDYAEGGFVGVRTPTRLIRIYGREAWGWGTAIAEHRFSAR